MTATLIPFPRLATKDELFTELRAIKAAEEAGRLSEAEHQARLFQFFVSLVCAIGAQERGLKPKEVARLINREIAAVEVEQGGSEASLPAQSLPA